jgi:hypothetical protein
MKTNFGIFILIVCFLLSSCDFNVNDWPGQQMSPSVKESKLHGTFICEYRVNGNNINGTAISSIFAEKQFSRQDNLLRSKEISCCESQLLVVSEAQPFSTQTTGYDTNWKIIGFANPSPEASIIYRYYKGTLFPDSIPIKVVGLRGKDSSRVIKRLTLYKVQGS